MHHPVLLQTVIEQLAVKKDGLYIDATAGEGGFIKKILEGGGKVLALEWDKEQMNRLKKNFESTKNLILVNENFAQIETVARQYRFYPVDGIIFDLGLSAEQIENSQRGFSYKKTNEPLDMRISQSLSICAADILNRFSFNDLYNGLSRFGEDINSKKIVLKIIEKRRIKPFKNVGDLTATIDQVLGKSDEKTYRRIFQALRIMVNNEIENLKKGLTGAVNVIKNDGRIVIISFHSVESRLIKQLAKELGLKKLNKKTILGERGSQLRVFTKN
jgi:16S rRNA (cytosine1402-N4)-methyltransferase